MKRIFKGPWLWIAVAVIGVIVALQYLAPSNGYDEIIDTGVRSARARSAMNMTAPFSTPTSRISRPA